MLWKQSPAQRRRRREWQQQRAAYHAACATLGIPVPEPDARPPPPPGDQRPKRRTQARKVDVGSNVQRSIQLDNTFIEDDADADTRAAAKVIKLPAAAVVIAPASAI